MYFIKYDPSDVLKHVWCPVLAVNGEKDLQVPPKKNLNAINDGLREGGNKKVKTMVYSNLNHLFQECEAGLPSEYVSIAQTFSIAVLADVTDWISNQVDGK